MSATPVNSPAQLDYGLDTPNGRFTRSVECRIGLEQVENDPFCFAIRVPAPLPEDLEQAKTLVLRVEGRRLQGTVRHSERLEDDSLRLEVEPD
ncbi:MULTISPECIES: hypothetical protein [unclassified Pseudomonas]|uniref:hypothetical protein n=1 Tax=unclassified Pseudomonas TaxID=196821 RepID=UPI000C8804FC|nr:MULTISPECIES: hypothetical protein [unclassified Pseudomonas]PMZ87938.1 hypothetical protein C1X61_15950 [Pseudomonas sp. FW215-T2]PNA09344.1 hypothetical protein C1X62_21715 [Pseudomonas sp. FW215-R3]PNB35540.1 hypothetical protein C1X63_22240 [Pseudomonas sp. FW305-131]